MKRITILSVFIALISLLLIPRSKNNVCKSFSDYYGDRDKNENCYYNPDTYMNVETLPVTLLQNSDATSYKTISHGLQLVSKGNFDYLDYGSEELNMAAYGSPEVPKHNLSRLSVPTYLVTAINDMMITVEDVKLLHEHLPKKVNPYDLYIVKHEAFNHDDFIAARDVVPLVYNPLVNFINNLS
uniref:Partial AB-hydrolase lipase domain-containing protein n=1 Tax=Photinus pyralis TaxID=7054 RepID=A0A1Y1KRV3_PHOPY